MPRLTVTITDEQAELLEEKTGDGGEYESKSEVVRNFIQAGERVEELERKAERLEREKRQVLEQREENTELVQFASDVREQRERRRSAPVWRRAKWWVFGEG